MDLKDAGTRRLLVALVTLLTPILNKKLMLGLDTEEITLIVEAGLGVLLMSNTKEVVQARAKAKGVKAAAEVKAGDSVDKALDELAGKLKP